jgi:hypothetical protein
VPVESWLSLKFPTEKGAVFNYRSINKSGFLPATIAATFLILAVSSHWPYFFYVLMRLTVCAIAAYLAHSYFVAARKLWLWVFGAVAILFNPVVPMRMHRSDWSVLDMISASVFVVWMVASLIGGRKAA